MKLPSKLALIGAGYALAIAAGAGAGEVNELRMSEEIQQGSPGMVAFGDMLLFIAVASFVALLPTWFLLRLAIEKAPRLLLAAVLFAALLGPLSWLSVIYLSRGPTPPDLPQIVLALLGLFVALLAIPRIVIGIALLMVEAMTFILVSGSRKRALIAGAMLLDLVPLALFALHISRAIH